MESHIDDRCSASYVIPNKAGLKLKIYRWSTHKPRAAIVLVHGIGSHARFDWLCSPAVEAQNEGRKVIESNISLTYENSWVRQFNEDGLEVFSYDLQGHGMSDAWSGRANVERLTDFVDDTLEVCRFVHETVPRLQSLYLCGLSMGGLVCALTLTQGLEDSSLRGATDTKGNPNAMVVNGVVLLAPALCLDSIKAKPLNRILFPISRWASRYLPGAHLASKAKNTKFPYIEDAFASDPLTFHEDRFPCRISYEMLANMDPVVDAAHLVKSIPVMLVHSKFDTMCDPAGSQRFYDNMTLNDDKALIILDSSWHFLTKEPGNNELAGKVSSWVFDRLPAYEDIEE